MLKVRISPPTLTNLKLLISYYILYTYQKWYFLFVCFSMQARKMQQTKNAMKTIIGEMRDQDFITILRYFFNHKCYNLQSKKVNIERYFFIHKCYFLLSKLYKRRPIWCVTFRFGEGTSYDVIFVMEYFIKNI